MKKKDAITVFISSRETICEECNEALGKNAWITLNEEKKPLCLECADLDHLAYLQSGDAALTRRSRKNSRLSAVVVKWSKRRKRYERQGTLVEEEAIEKAEAECIADEHVRKQRRAQAAVRRNELDEKYIEQFAKKIRAYFPRCPKGREEKIAAHACRKYSGRVGRTAAAKELNQKMVELAVVAHVRHTESTYDDLLSQGYNRRWAREQVKIRMSEVLSHWKAG